MHVRMSYVLIKEPTYLLTYGTTLYTYLLPRLVSYLRRKTTNAIVYREFSNSS